MANELYVATVMDFSVSKPSNQSNLNALVPYFDNIRLISGEHVQLSLLPPYFGDTVNLGFWKSVRINVGSSDFSHPLYNLTSGYQYILNCTQMRFVVINDTGNVVETVNNVKSMADLNISFDIYKSHQFIIQLDAYDTLVPFFISAVYKGIVSTGLELTFSSVSPPNQSDISIYLDGARLSTIPDYFSVLYKPTDSSLYIELGNLDFVNLSFSDYLDVNYLSIVCYLYDLLYSDFYFQGEYAYDNSIFISEHISSVHSYDIDFSNLYGTNYFYMGTLELLQLWIGREIIPPPYIDPEKCYDEGDFWGGNPYIIEDTRESTTYVVYSNPICCTTSGGTGIGNQLIVLIHDLVELREPVLGDFYKKGSVIEVYIDGVRSYFLVKQDVYLSRLDFSPKYFDRICLLLLQVIKEKVFVATELLVNWLIPMWSLTLYQMLQPVIRDGETQNNRPIYEPWIIWGFYNFIHSSVVNDIVDYLHEVPTWDLSPNWG